MAFLGELLASTVQYVLMIGVMIGCCCLGAAVSRHKKKKAK